MKIKLFGHPLKTRAYGTVPVCDRSRKMLQKNGIETSVRPNGTPVMPILRSRNTQKFFVFVQIVASFGIELITTGKTGNTHCLPSGHKINWFLAFETLPVFPVVIFRHISRDKGQKAGPQMCLRLSWKGDN